MFILFILEEQLDAVDNLITTMDLTDAQRWEQTLTDHLLLLLLCAVDIRRMDAYKISHIGCKA